jgi:hypothetical protein
LTIGLLTTQGFIFRQILLLAMGLSVTTALAAKGITVSQLINPTAAEQNVDPSDAHMSDLVEDDGGAVNLTKVQMLGWIEAQVTVVTRIEPTTRTCRQGTRQRHGHDRTGPIAEKEQPSSSSSILARSLANGMTSTGSATASADAR